MRRWNIREINHLYRRRERGWDNWQVTETLEGNNEKPWAQKAPNREIFWKVMWFLPPFPRGQSQTNRTAFFYSELFSTFQKSQLQISNVGEISHSISPVSVDDETPHYFGQSAQNGHCENYGACEIRCLFSKTKRYFYRDKWNIISLEIHKQNNLWLDNLCTPPLSAWLAFICMILWAWRGMQILRLCRQN